MKKAAFLLSLLLPLLSVSEVLATNAKIPLKCQESATSTMTDGSELCLQDELWLDLVVGANIIALQVSGERKLVTLGAAPAFGLQLAWKPEVWTATPYLMGVEITVAGTLLDLTGGGQLLPSHFEAWTVLGVNMFGFWSMGLGGRFGLKTRNLDADGNPLKDFAHMVITSGFRVPI